MEIIEITDTWLTDRAMQLSFYEATPFARNREEHFGGDEGFRRLQNALLDNPRLGLVIPGCGGVRKVRWPATGQGKGKRGGLRIIYLYVEEAAAILFMLLYTKNEAEDLTPDEKRQVAELARQFREEIIQKGKQS